MKTLKQIADEMGVTKPAVYKKVNGRLKDSLRDHIHVAGGTVYIDARGEDIIKADRLAQQPPIEPTRILTTDNDNRTAETIAPARIPTTDNGTVAAQQLHIESLTRELESKDTTINVLTLELAEKNSTIKELTKLLDQGQQLQLTITNDLHATIQLWTNRKKKGLLSFFSRSD